MKDDAARADLLHEPAPAKINLTLHVTGRREDGYHLLDSLVVFAGPADSIAVAPAADWSLEITGPQAKAVPPGDDNLVLAAARHFGGPPARLVLDKHLPAAAGLGGGSSDAAATLRALARCSGRPLPGDLHKLGADIPVCIENRPMRMRGIGERLDPFTPPPLHLCLVNPGVPLSTPAVFGALERRDNPAMPERLPDFSDTADFAAWLVRETRNDLEDPACRLAHPITDALAALERAPGCLLARMSGSGATCFGLFQDDVAARDAAWSIGKTCPHWWVRQVS